MSNTSNAFSFTNIQGGRDPNDPGTLDQQQEYWYACRYVYLDGHKTNLSFPKLVKTENLNRVVRLEIQNIEDLNGEPCIVEVFRKKGAEDFFYIGNADAEETDPSVLSLFIDDGKPNIRPLDEIPYVWTKRHESQEIVRDRYVRSNVEYHNPDFEIDASVSTETDPEFEDFPINAKANLYSRVRYEDGTLSFHKEIGTIQASEENTKLSVQLNNVSSDREIKETGFYVKYDNVSADDEIIVNSIELYNSKIPSLATRNKEEIEQDRPVNAHVFLGWKYVHREMYAQGDSFFMEDYIIDSDFNTNPDEPEEARANRIFLRRIEGTATRRDRPFFFPDTETFHISGQDVKYDLEALQPLDTAPGNDDTNLAVSGAFPVVGIYRIAFYDAVRQGVRDGKVKVRFNKEKYFESNPLIGNKVATPVSFLDINENKRTRFQTDSITFGGLTISSVYPNNSRLYLVFDDQDLIEYADVGVQSNDILKDYTVPNSTQNLSSNQLTASFSISLLNIKELETFSPDSERTTTSSYDLVVKPLTLYNRIRNYLLTRTELPESEALFFLGSTYNSSDTITFPITGYEKIQNTNLIRWGVPDYNIVENLITKDDLRQLTQEYPNQLIWSDPYIIETNSSGNRRFRLESFLNISREYGEIVDIKYANNTVLVFCKRGVAVVNVGEVLTQTATGETVVASENFLSSEQWGLKNLPDVQRNTIKQYENMIFFCDGRDVWMYNGQFGNISQGAVELARPATFNASIDPKNKEYRITDRDQTWAYNFEVGEWFGPYTYKDARNTLFKERFFSAKDGDLIEHNLSNLFWRKDYETVIRSVANDLQEPSIDKIFRKLYFDFEGNADVSYGSDTKNSSQLKRKNGNYHLGIDRKMKNNKRLIWTIRTKAKDFVLRMVSFEWLNRNRR